MGWSGKGLLTFVLNDMSEGGEKQGDTCRHRCAPHARAHTHKPNTDTGESQPLNTV